MPKFVSVTWVAPPTAELARGEKLHTQSLNQVTHWPSLFDLPQTEAFAWE